MTRRALLALELALALAVVGAAGAQLHPFPGPGRAPAGGCGDGAVPTIRGVGAQATGTGSISPALNAGTAEGDLVIVWCETANEALTISGYSAVPSSPQGTGTAGAASATRLSAFYKIAGAGEGAPSTTFTGNHDMCATISIQAGTFCASSPFDGSGGGVVTPASTGISIPGATTTTANALVLTGVATAWDTDASAGTNAACSGWTNAGLTTIGEQLDERRISGNGGIYCVHAWSKASAGATGTTTGTTSNDVQGGITLAIQSN